MRADRFQDPQEAERRRAPAVNFRDPPHKPHRLRGDEQKIDNGARTDGGDDGHALGCACDFISNAIIKRQDEFALGDVDEIASVDDLAGEVFHMGASARGVGARAVQ